MKLQKISLDDIEKMPADDARTVLKAMELWYRDGEHILEKSNVFKVAVWWGSCPLRNKAWLKELKDQL